MPIDLESLHDPRRAGEAESYLEATHQLREQVAERSAVKLGVVPDDQSYADLFAAVLQRVKQKRALSSSSRSSRSSGASLGKVVSRDNNEQFELINIFSADAAESRHSMASSTRNNSSDHNDSLEVVADKVWDALERVPLASPFGGGIGALSASGESFIQLAVTSHLFRKYPRLRSAHVQSLLHSVAGLQPMVRLGQEIGLVHLCNMQTDAGLWKELCNLQQREENALKNLSRHSERHRLQLTNNQRWLYKRELRLLQHALRHFPADAATLLPRVEWIRNLVFGFVGWLQLAEGEAAAAQFVDEKILVLFDADAEISAAWQEREVRGEDPDEHPLNKKNLRRAHRLNHSSTHIHGAEPFDDPFDRYSAEQLLHLANRRVQEAVTPNNALKEAQIILNYSPFVPRAELATNDSGEPNKWNQHGDDDDADYNDKSAVKFDVEVNAAAPHRVELASDSATVDVEGESTKAHGALSTKMLEAALFVWKKNLRAEGAREKVLLGRGQGLSEQDAVQAACLDFVRRYYFSPLS